MEIVTGVRAKYGYLAKQRRRKDGQLVPVADEIVISDGMFSAKEMERELIRIAEAEGVPTDAVRVVPYEHGETPDCEVNPRHRGFGPRYSRLPSEPREVRRPEPRRRRYWGGWSPPQDSESERK